VSSVRQWKALFGLVSAVAVVGPAAGLAYLGVRQSRAERDRARQAFETGNRKEARFLAGALDDEAKRTLDAVAQAFVQGEAAGSLRARYPFAEEVFRIDPLGHLTWPATDEEARLSAEASQVPDRPAARALLAGPERTFEDYVTRLRRQRRAARLLAEARAAEARALLSSEAAPPQSPERAREARRLYLSLINERGEGAAQALLGLARLDLAAGHRDEARRRYRDLRQRHGGERDREGISYALLADLGEAFAADAPALLRLYGDLVDGHYQAPPGALLAFAASARVQLGRAALDPQVVTRLAELDRRAELARATYGFAASMAGESADLARSASAEAQARRAASAPGRLLVFRRDLAGGTVGFAVSLAPIRAVAEKTLAGDLRAGTVPRATRVVVDAGPGAGRPDLLAAERPGLLHNLSVSLIGDAREADRAASAQLARYLALVAGLMAMLTLGVVAVWRGAARARELSQLKSDFVSTVSHELRTPLTSIRMFGEMLREGMGGGDHERERRYHDVIVRESERLSRLIANVLDFSQIERGARRYDRKPVDLSALAEEAVATFGRLADGEAHPTRIDVDTSAHDVRIAADREAIVQSLLNLLSNAAKYGGPGKAIEIRLSADAAHARIAVVDQGPGLSIRESKRIFREFYRAPEALRSGVEGTGLGLALVKRHVEAHQGDVVVDSAPGRGATFTLVLPRAEALA